MPYDYASQKQHVFTEDGQVMFVKIRDKAKEHISKAGVVMSGALMRACTGDTWTMLACMDRMIETGDLLEVPNSLSRAGQHRLFTNFDWANI